MVPKTWWTALLGLTVLAAPAFGQVKLEWKFKEGDTFFVEASRKIKQTIEYKGQSTTQDTEDITVSRFKVRKKTKEGVVLEQEILSAKLKRPNGGNAVNNIARRMKGAVFTITLDSSGKFTKFEGYAALINRLARNNQQAIEMTKMMLPRETLEKMAGEVYGFLPQKSVKKGERWTRDLVLPLGSIGGFKEAMTFTDEGKTKEGQKISITSKLTLGPLKNGENLPFKITKTNLKNEGIGGTILFDPKMRRLVKSDVKGTIKGTITVSLGDQDLEMMMKQKFQITTKVMDKDPTIVANAQPK
jgi:hypothetical protein